MHKEIYMQNIKKEKSYTINENNYPEPNSWQRQIQALEELDCASGVCWHSSTSNKQVIRKTYSQAQKLKFAQRVVASWYVQMDGKYVDTANKNTKFGMQEILKLIPIRLAETFPNDALIEENINKFAEAAMFGASSDPRLAFGVYSGKAYPDPGNPSRRLFRNGMWDINTWQMPAYRYLAPSNEAHSHNCAFTQMLEFAIPREKERSVLLDWISWNLQNEYKKPTWSVLLFSEKKGTGKSTIGEVLTALFGLKNSMPINGIKKLTHRFSADILEKKFILAEEVHISSHSNEGNALKDLITNTTVSVEPKYQPVVSIPQRSCFLFTTNHKPLWLEGGERRYFIIDMDHEGHAQGLDNDTFVKLVQSVKAQINTPQALRDLYSRLIVRQQSSSFDPMNMRFTENATLIMQELQSSSVNESDKVLEELLQQYMVSVIPSEDIAELSGYLRSRSVTALRNSLNRLGWEARRIRFGGEQHRAWCKNGTVIENGRVNNEELAREHGKRSDQSEDTYSWFDIGFFIQETWYKLRAERLKSGYNKFKGDYSAVTDSLANNANGEYGPFKDSKSHLRLQARFDEEVLEMEQRHSSKVLSIASNKIKL